MPQSGKWQIGPSGGQGCEDLALSMHAALRSVGVKDALTTNAPPLHCVMMYLIRNSSVVLLIELARTESGTNTQAWRIHVVLHVRLCDSLRWAGVRYALTSNAPPCHDVMIYLI